MPAKSAKTKANYRQEAYHADVLQDGDAMERLREQWSVISQLGWPSTLDNPSALHQVIGELDVDLIRFSLMSLRSHLDEAAIRDTSQLIAEVVLDSSGKELACQRWEKWLNAAPCWPLLTMQHWGEARQQAAWIVVEALTESGVDLDSTAQADLADRISQLSPQDLLPKETMQRLFPRAEERGEH